MTEPRASYRLQFRGGMTFYRAAELVPYLADLGISHLYASPIFTAAPGSTHGYDVANHQELDPELGGEEGFRRLAQALKEHGLGLLLDIVPNHMAVSTANPWWRDILKHGRHSRYARHFDIDWSAEKLLLPVLGEPYGEALAEGKLKLRIDETSGEPVFGYYDLALPLSPDSLPVLLREDGDGPKDRATLEKELESANRDDDLLHELHEAQHWRLSYWRLAREALTYRRFFEIADLIGVRVEDETVFSDVHQLALGLTRQGVVEGLRIDHIDGLADPKGYLERLAGASGLDYVLVEKILGPGEELRADWRASGTTGYEIGQLITGLQVDRRNVEAMTEAWTGFTGDNPDFMRQVLSAKRRMLTVNLAGELDGLVQLAHRIALQNPSSRDFGRDALRLALIELAATLPVYRTYIDREGASDEDRELVARAVERVDRGREVEDERVIAFVASLLLDPVDGSADRAAFITRFQQTTGPLMAKAVEDTVFYRYNRLIALNEVGAEPAEFGVEAEAFHAAMERRVGHWPAMSATATHDTKRGEDARARLAVLSEMPEEWGQAVRRWHQAAEELREDRPHGPVPGPRGEWLFFQAVAGAWPPELTLEDEDGLGELSDRLVSFMTKALREAKRRTSWTAPDDAFESAVESYVRELFSPERRVLLAEVRSLIARIEPAGIVNSLAQLALKMTLPGVPDIYQGCELLDFSMVDPDNRRPVDFDLRRRLLTEARELGLAEALERWREGVPKLWLLDRLLGLRTRMPSPFKDGDYRPVEVRGDRAEHVVAFSRTAGEESIIVAVPRLVLGLINPERPPRILRAALAETRLVLPQGRSFATLAGQPIEGQDGEVALSELWEDMPVAVLVSAGATLD
jgi:(1->4)-alpha-D-glucan 1-alpha-D-glucosylmutase